MRTLIIADVHGNHAALSAVLAAPEARRCQRIVSLGDQVNWGVESREVLLTLSRLGATMLMGNHEHRLRSVRDPAYAGYNWALQRFTAQQVADLPLHLPTDVRRGGMLFTHGTPGDCFHLIDEGDLPGVLHALPHGVTHLFSGHNHRPWMVRRDGFTACNPGSVGLWENGVGGTAPFAVLEEAGRDAVVTCHTAAYELRGMKQRFLDSGAVAVAPEICRMVLHVMRTGEYQGVLKLVRHVQRHAEAAGLTLGHREAWLAAEGSYPWAEPVSTAEYWQIKEESP